MPIILMNLNGYNNKYNISISGNITNKAGMTIPPRVGKSRYLFVTLDRDGKQVSKRVDKLVAKQWLSNTRPKLRTEVIHLDGNRANNYPHNLFWVIPSNYDKWQTHLDNKIKKKLANKGTKSSKSVLVTDTHTGKVTKYDSPALAAESLGFTPQKLRKALRESISLNNFKFQYQ